MAFIMMKFSIHLEKHIQSGNSEMTLDRNVSSSKQWKSNYLSVDVVAYVVLSASIMGYDATLQLATWTALYKLHNFTEL